MSKIPFELTKSEYKFLRRLNTPVKIQDFLERLPIRFDEEKTRYRSPRFVIQAKEAYCFEAAVLAAAALYANGEAPLLLDLRSLYHDDDHVIALFKRHNRWGAISKTNHAVLRYRDPVYRDVRELALSYFNEYFLDSGQKTLRWYSKPFDLRKFNKQNWITTDRDLYFIAEALDLSKHFEIADKRIVRSLRKADPIEIKVGKLTQWKEKASRG